MWFAQTINKPHLPGKKGLDLMQVEIIAQEPHQNLILLGININGRSDIVTTTDRYYNLRTISNLHVCPQHKLIQWLS